MPTANKPASERRSAPVARRKRTDLIVDAIKQMIVERDLGPGDRLPQEKDLMTQFSAGKSTVREALKSLEVQGLVSVRTGPGGGAAIERMSEGRAMSLLSNFLFAKNLTSAHVQAMREVLEPMAAVSALPHLDADGYGRLGEIVEHFADDPGQAELDFHGVLASYSDNPLLAFSCRFLQRLLGELAPDSAAGMADAAQFRALISALESKDAAAVRTLAARLPERGDAPLTNRFLAEPDAPARTKRKPAG